MSLAQPDLCFQHAIFPRLQFHGGFLCHSLPRTLEDMCLYQRSYAFEPATMQLNTRSFSVCVCARPKLDSIHLNPLWCPQYDLVWVDLSSQSWRYSTSIPCDTRRVLDIAKTDFGGLEVLAEGLRPWSPKGRIGSGCQIGYPWPPKIHQNPRFQKIWLYIGGKSTCYLEKSEGILCHETTSNPRLASLCYSPIDVLQFRYLHQHAQTSDDFCVLQRSHRLFLKIRIPSGNLT